MISPGFTDPAFSMATLPLWRSTAPERLTVMGCALLTMALCERARPALATITHVKRAGSSFLVVLPGCIVSLLLRSRVFCSIGQNVGDESSASRLTHLQFLVLIRPSDEGLESSLVVAGKLVLLVRKET